MVSKILFLVLVGCALVLASPVKREGEKSTEVEKPQESIEWEFVEIDEEELKEIVKEIEEKFDDIFNEVNNQFKDKDFQEALKEVKEAMDKIFGKKKEESQE